MTQLSEFERDAERAVQALRIAADYLSGENYEGYGAVSPRESVLFHEGLAAAERVLSYLGSLRRPGDGASAPYPGWSSMWHDWCPHRAPRLTGGFPLRHRHGDPGE